MRGEHVKIIIIGVGAIGKALATLLSTKDHEIVLIEKEESLAKGVANDTDALVIHGDGTEMEILKDAGIEDSDAVIAVTGDDKVNLMVCEIAKSMNIKHIISRVNKSANEEIFTKLGISGVVPLVDLAVTSIKRLLLSASTDHRTIAELGGGAVQILALTVGEDSHLTDKPAIIKDAIVASVYRDGDLIIPDAKTKIEANDVLVIVTKTENLSKVTAQISGNKNGKKNGNNNAETKKQMK